MDLKSREGRRQQGELIKAAAAASGLTLKELAGRLGVSHALIYQYVSGANLAQPDKLQEIAQVTGTSIGYFFGESSAGAPPAPGLLVSQPRTVESGLPSAMPAPGQVEKAPEPAQVLSAPVVSSPAARPTDALATVDQARLLQTVRQMETLAACQDSAGRDVQGLIRTLEQMLGLARLSGDLAREADILLRIGNARTDSGDMRGAIESLRLAAALCQDLSRLPQQLAAEQSLARCCSLMGQLVEAEALFRKVARADDLDLRWRGLLGLGQILEQQDRYEDALAEFEKAGDTVEKLTAGPGSPRRLAEMYVRTNVSNIYMAEGDFKSALEGWQRNLEQAEDQSQPDQFLEALISESVCRLFLGQPGAAHELCRRAIRICRLLGDIERLAVARAAFAESFAYCGLFDEGIAQAREAAKLSSECASGRSAGFAHLALARNLMLAGQVESARVQIEIELMSPYLRNRVTALLLRSELARRAGDPGEAVANACEALDWLGDTGMLHLERAAWTSLAFAAAGTSREPLLDKALGRAAELENQTPGLPESNWQWCAAQGRHHRAQGDSAGAAEWLARSVTIIQALRSDLMVHGVIETLLDDSEKFQVYEDALAAAADAGKPELKEMILREANWPPLSDSAGTGNRG